MCMVEVEIISILYTPNRAETMEKIKKKKKRYQLNMSVAYGIASKRRYGIYRGMVLF